MLQTFRGISKYFSIVPGAGFGSMDSRLTVGGMIRISGLKFGELVFQTEHVIVEPVWT